MTPPKEPNQRGTAREIAAQCWCDPRTSAKVLDIELCEVFAEKLEQAIKQAMAEGVHSVLSESTWPERRYQQGYSAAREQAAKIVRPYTRPGIHGALNADDMLKDIQAMTMNASETPEAEGKHD